MEAWPFESTKTRGSIEPPIDNWQMKGVCEGMYGPAGFVLIASPMHIVGGDEPARSEVKYIMYWFPNCATSGAHMACCVAQAGGSGSASLGVPHCPNTVPERTGTV